MLCDAHCHLDGSSELAALQRDEHILALINCQSPTEWETNRQLVDGHQPLSFGIHPWQATELRWSEITPYLEATNIIGEIGMDSVWTDVNLLEQARIFEAQLRFAHDHRKPVVLHTKGCERAVLTNIQKYPNRYLVHWYASPEYQADYIRLDCYFTIGPDVLTDPAVTQLAKTIPLNRLLIETDGLAAVTWAQHRPVTVTDYPMILKQSLRIIANLRGMAPAELEANVYQNLQQFLS